MLPKKQRRKSPSCSSLTVPELDQSKIAVLNMLASAHSRRSYKNAIEKFIAWYCSEPRLAFNKTVVQRYGRCCSTRHVRKVPASPRRSRSRSPRIAEPPGRLGRRPQV